MKKNLYFILLLICFVLLVLDVFVDKSHAHSYIEYCSFSFAVFGFLSTFFYVFIAKVLKKIVLKDEDFYDKF